MRDTLVLLVFLLMLLAFVFWIGGYHIVWKPTADELFGCTVEQQTPDGECK